MKVWPTHLHEYFLGVAAPRHKELRLVQVEHPPPWQQEGRLLVAEHQLADVDQALEGLALLELGLAVPGFAACG